jgi:hypothetical protein
MGKESFSQKDAFVGLDNGLTTMYNYWYRTMNPSDTESEPESDGS